MSLNFNNNNNQIFVFSIIIAILFFIFIMPFIEDCKNKETENFNAQIDNLLSGDPKSIFSNKCARSCCINTGWPYPAELLEKDISPEELKKYVPNNFACAIGSDLNGGCLCATQEDMDYLTRRGGNSKYNSY